VPTSCCKSLLCCVSGVVLEEMTCNHNHVLNGKPNWLGLLSCISIGRTAAFLVGLDIQEVCLLLVWRIQFLCLSLAFVCCQGGCWLVFFKLFSFGLVFKSYFLISQKSGCCSVTSFSFLFIIFFRWYATIFIGFARLSRHLFLVCRGAWF